MGRRTRLATRCIRCRVHADRCVCHAIPRLDVRTRLVVVMHQREWTKTTGTAHLMALAVPSCEIVLRGLPGEAPDLAGLAAPDRRAWVLYPSEDARPLTPALVAEDPRPVTLVVPDGSWRQASKMPRREPALRELPRVRLVDDGPSRYWLRDEPKDGGLATFEAMARALGVLEGREVRVALERLFDAMVAATLATRHTPPRRRG